jgi:hypothetical protein
LTPPGRHTLAEVLRKAADDGWTPSARLDAYDLPWPLAACFEFSRDRDSLYALANRAEQGELGDFADWQAAETRWERHGVTVADLRTQPRKSVPFDSSIGTVGWPGYVRIASDDFQPSWSTGDLHALLAIIREQPPKAVSEMLLQFLGRAGLGTDDVAQVIGPADLRQLLEQVGLKAWCHPDLIALPADDSAHAAWLAFFDWLGRSDFLAPPRRSSPVLLDNAWLSVWHRAFVENPTRRGLLRLLGHYVSLRESLPFTPEQALTIGPSEPACFRLAALLVKLARVDLTVEQAERLADEAVPLLTPSTEQHATARFFAAAEFHLELVPNVIHILTRLHAQLPAGDPRQLPCEHLLRGVARTRLSTLGQRDAAEALELPHLPVRHPGTASVAAR